MKTTAQICFETKLKNDAKEVLTFSNNFSQSLVSLSWRILRNAKKDFNNNSHVINDDCK